MEGLSDAEIQTILRSAHPRRIFAIYTVLKQKGPEAVTELNKITGYDRWFLFMMCQLLELENKLESEELTTDLMEEAKKAGFDSHVELIKELYKRKDGQFYRIELGALNKDPRIELRNSPIYGEELDDLQKKLLHLDSFAEKAWTLQTLKVTEST